MWRSGFLLLLSCSLASAQVPPRPAWAEGAQAFGELRPSFGESDLTKFAWRPEVGVCSTEKAIFVLDASVGKLFEFDGRGNQRDIASLRNFPQGLGGRSPWSGLACDGELFAFWKQNRVLLFTRSEVVRDFTVQEAMALSDLAIAGNRLLAAVVPVVFRSDLRTFASAEHLVWELDLEGSGRRPWLDAEKVEGFAKSVAQEVLLAPHKDLVWVVSQHKRYKLRLFDEGGREIWAFQTKGELPAEEGAQHLPEHVKRSLTPEAQSRAQGLDVPFVARDLVVSDGLAWVLLDRNFIKVENAVVVDVFSAKQEKPLLRLALQPKQNLVFLRVAVTNKGVWLFPGGDGRPEGFETPPVGLWEGGGRTLTR